MNFPRKFIIFSIALLFIINLSGCGKKQEKKDLFSVIKERGKIVAGVRYDAKPFGFMDEDGQVKGFDIDLCREIAYRLLGNRNAIEFKQVTSSNRILSITSGSIDFAAATMTITPQRAEIIDFSNPYFVAGQALMVPENSPIKSLHDLKRKKIIVSIGSTSEINIRKLVPDAEILGFRTYTDAFSALRTGRGDALTTDDTIIYGFISEYPGYTILKERLTKEPYGLGFKKNLETYTLRETINTIIKEMNEDGTMAQLEKKWTKDILEKRQGEGIIKSETVDENPKTIETKEM